MSEKFDVYNANGINKNIVKSSDDALAQDEYRMATKIWFYADGKFLIQKRAQSLKRSPGKWSPTCGKAIVGERPRHTAIRECREEIGIQLSIEELHLVEHLKVGKFYIYVFVVKKNIDINSLNLQKNEVETVEWIDKERIKQLIEEGEFFAKNEEFEHVLEKINKV